MSIGGEGEGGILAKVYIFTKAFYPGPGMKFSIETVDNLPISHKNTIGKSE